MVVVVDYGMGNLRSIQYKLSKAGVPALCSSKVEEIAAADKLILPGVGHFAEAMKNLAKYGLIPILNKKVLEDKTPFLGICLGMQLVTRHSEEGNVAGLGWIDAETRRFQFENGAARLPIPHIGWNQVRRVRSSVLFEGLEAERRFYFVHSYHVCCNDEADVLGTAHYGYDFTCMLQRGNIYATQFHPEKSHRRGFEMMLQFVRHAGS